MSELVLDATNAVVGRLATKTAKALLNKKKVIIINAEQAIITGNPYNTKRKYFERIKRGSPQHGPFFPRTPDRILRRAIRGMLPKNFKPKLTIHIGSAGLKGEKTEKKLKTNFIRLKDLSKSLGWKG
jgi:large subunit ribosomal protein L13